MKNETERKMMCEPKFWNEMCLKSKRNKITLFCSILKFSNIYFDKSKPYTIVYSTFSHVWGYANKRIFSGIFFLPYSVYYTFTYTFFN